MDLCVKIASVLLLVGLVSIAQASAEDLQVSVDLLSKVSPQLEAELAHCAKQKRKSTVECIFDGPYTKNGKAAGQDYRSLIKQFRSLPDVQVVGSCYFPEIGKVMDEGLRVREVYIATGAASQEVNQFLGTIFAERLYSCVSNYKDDLMGSLVRIMKLLKTIGHMLDVIGAAKPAGEFVDIRVEKEGWLDRETAELAADLSKYLKTKGQNFQEGILEPCKQYEHEMGSMADSLDKTEALDPLGFRSRLPLIFEPYRLGVKFCRRVIKDASEIASLV